jgi:S-formylglutathione hydrolase FrmB
MRVTRRNLLQGAGVAAALGVLGGAGATADVLPGGSWMRRHLGMTGEPGTVPSAPPARVEFFARDSAARRTRVECLVATPTGSEGRSLPVCLALHGRGSSARGMAELGLPQFLSAAVAQGAQPIALVAPDGGEHYWHDDGSGDDPMRMLEDELPAWLAERGLDTPSAVLGVSMGGFGALSFARRRLSLRATAALSPALFQTWSDAQSLRAFPEPAVWEANDPLRRAGELDGRRLGVWCGNADVFYDAAREFAKQAHPAIAAFEPGDHTPEYWRRVLPNAVRFLTERLR